MWWGEHHYSPFKICSRFSTLGVARLIWIWSKIYPKAQNIKCNNLTSNIFAICSIHTQFPKHMHPSTSPPPPLQWSKITLASELPWKPFPVPNSMANTKQISPLPLSAVALPKTSGETLSFEPGESCLGAVCVNVFYDFLEGDSHHDIMFYFCFVFPFHCLVQHFWDRKFAFLVCLGTWPQL